MPPPTAGVQTQTGQISGSQFILATGGYDTYVRIFNAQNQSLVRTVQFCDQHVIRVAFSGKGKVAVNQPLYLVVGGSLLVCVYDVSTNDTPPNIFAPFKGHTEPVTAVGFEPINSSFVYSASEDGTLQTWLPESAHSPHMYAGMNAPYGTQGAANGLYARAPINRGLGVYPLPSGRTFCPTKFENRDASGIVPIHDAIYFPPDDLFFTADAKGRLRIWDHASQRLRREIIPHPSARNLQCLELASDYRILVLANFDGMVFVYDVKKMLADADVVPISFRANSSYITRVRLSPQSNLLVCTTKQGAVKVFRMQDIKASRALPIEGVDMHEESVTPVWDFGSHPGWVWDAAFVGESEDFIFTCSSNRQVMLWTLENLEHSLEYKGHEKPVVCLAVKERFVGKPVNQFRGGVNPNTSLASSLDNINS